MRKQSKPNRNYNIEYFHKRNNELIKINDLLADKNDRLEKKLNILSVLNIFLSLI